MTFTTSRGVLREDFLAGERGVASSTAVGVATDVAVSVTDVVSVILLKGIVGHITEALAPKNEAFIHGEADAFEEESILETSVMFQMVIFTKCHM